MGDTNRWYGRNPLKDQIRNQVWELLFREGASTSLQMGHIPNFIRTNEAAQQLAKQSFWHQADTIKCNPDTAQIPVRLAALKAGKRVLMAVPQLRTPHCFVSLSAKRVKATKFTLQEAAIAHHALAIGQPIAFEDMPTIDLVIVGCVAVDEQGGRTGKGAGFADLELGMLKSFGLVGSQTVLATTVDSKQIVKQALPMEGHDWPLDWIITPDKAIATQTRYDRPKGIDWLSIQTEQWQQIPALIQMYTEERERWTHIHKQNNELQK